MVPGLANAQAPGSTKFANAPPRDCQGGQMPCSSLEGALGTAGIDWYIRCSKLHFFEATDE